MQFFWSQKVQGPAVYMHYYALTGVKVQLFNEEIISSSVLLRPKEISNFTGMNVL